MDGQILEDYSSIRFYLLYSLNGERGEGKWFDEQLEKIKTKISQFFRVLVDNFPFLSDVFRNE